MKQAPRFSVCTPFWNRQDALDGMFENYAKHYAEIDLEFSVADDGSQCPAIVPPGVVLTRLRTKRMPLNPCVPINASVKASSGEIVVLTNPEIRHAECTLLSMYGLLTGPNDYVTACCIDVDTGQMLAGPKVNYSRGGRLPVPPGAHFHFCAMLHRELWERAGGFDESYRYGQACDDNDWLWRLADVGARFKSSPSVVLHTRSGVKWLLPHNREKFLATWPEVRRDAIVRRMAEVLD